nr:MAG TPA: hypothetical protein [Caudoviricetes sp.]
MLSAVRFRLVQPAYGRPPFASFPGGPAHGSEPD